MRYTEEQLEWILKNTPGHHYKEVTEAFNKTFNTDKTLIQIAGIAKRIGVKTGFNGRFEKGHTPKNKGTKGVYNVGGNSTSFKPGHIPKNHRPVGSERIDADGYVMVKVAEPNVWKPKHRVLWEQQIGAIPKGRRLLFKDQNKLNIRIDNLMLVTAEEMAIVNKLSMLKTNADLNETAVNTSKLILKIEKRRRNKK